MAFSIASSIVDLLSNKVVVELLWTLKSHSLGQPEGQVEMFSKLHFISLFDLHRLSILGLNFLVHHYLPLQAIFYGKLVVHPHRIPTLGNTCLL
jgi:hypothetical protein